MAVILVHGAKLSHEEVAELEVDEESEEEDEEEEEAEPVEVAAVDDALSVVVVVLVVLLGGGGGGPCLGPGGGGLGFEEGAPVGCAEGVTAGDLLEPHPMGSTAAVPRKPRQ